MLHSNFIKYNGWNFWLRCNMNKKSLRCFHSLSHAAHSSINTLGGGYLFGTYSCQEPQYDARLDTRGDTTRDTPAIAFADPEATKILNIWCPLALCPLLEKEGDIFTPPLRKAKATQNLCPVPNCGKRERRLWNHLFKYHKRKGTHTGKFTYTCNYMYA